MYDINGNTGEEEIGAAHPEGSHQMNNVDGDALVETVFDVQKALQQMIAKKPTGKLAETLSAVNIIIAAGKVNKKFRLEAGNHRIQVLHQHGIKMIPVTVQVREECGPHLDDVMTDASHNFDAGDEFLISKITREYMKPSEVFKSLHDKNK